jgi:hypothetical protein
MTELFRHAGESTKRVVAAVGDAAHDATETGPSSYFAQRLRPHLLIVIGSGLVPIDRKRQEVCHGSESKTDP